MDKFHFCPISGVRIVKMTKSKNMLTGGGTKTCYLYILPYIQGQESANAKKSKRKKGSQEEELGQAVSISRVRLVQMPKKAKEKKAHRKRN